MDKDFIRVLLYSYYSTITGWGVLLNYNPYYGDPYIDEGLGFKGLGVCGVGGVWD